MEILKIDSSLPGGGLVLLAESLRMSPHTQEIVGELAESNQMIFHEMKMKGLSHVRALRETPAYKTRARCGFNVITDAKDTGTTRPILVTVPASSEKRSRKKIHKQP